MLVSMNYLAELTGKDRRAVARRLSHLPTTPGPKNSKQVDSREALELIYGGNGDGAHLDPSKERALLDRERRRQLELTNGRLERELIPKDEVAAAWSANVAIAKGRLLSLPSRVSSEVLRLTSQREIENAIRDRINEILTELSGDPVKD